MLSTFVTTHRLEIMERCRERVAARIDPASSPNLELDQRASRFLDLLGWTLAAPVTTDDRSAIGATAMEHGRNQSHAGLTVTQVVHDYGDVCHSITQLALERDETFTTGECQVLNLCLEAVIAGAVSHFEPLQDVDSLSGRATSELGFLAHELRNLLQAATLACDALTSGSVGGSGRTAELLQRSLTGMGDLIARSFAHVRLEAGIVTCERIAIGRLIEDVELSAIMQAKQRGHRLTFEVHDAGAVILADPQIVAAIIANLVQNAFKYTRACSHVMLRTFTTPEHVRIEVEDECGGLPPGKAESLFKPFEQRGTDRSGLGLGLAICSRGVVALGGTIQVRDIPGKGCIFLVELPRAPVVHITSTLHVPEASRS